LVTSALVRAPELQNAEILVQFSRQRIEINSALCKRTSENRFEMLRQFATLFQNVFFKIRIGYIWLQSWPKNAKLDGKIFFLLNVCWFCRKKILRILAMTARI
jgi:hypothetical protein